MVRENILLFKIRLRSPPLHAGQALALRPLLQFGRASAPMIPQRVHMRGPNDGTGTSYSSSPGCVFRSRGGLGSGIAEPGRAQQSCGVRCRQPCSTEAVATMMVDSAAEPVA
jgi:hypothetical protein